MRRKMIAVTDRTSNEGPSVVLLLIAGPSAI